MPHSAAKPVCKVMQNSTQAPKRTCFEVADVTPATKALPEMAAKAALERTTRTRALICSNENGRVLQQGDFHPLIAAAYLAFSQHYPLVLSPDMIWLTLLQGVAQHVQNHAEALRQRLVFHETKIELVVDTNLASFPRNDQEMLYVAREFVSRIARHVPPAKQFLFEAEFSTTTDVDRIATSVALMDAFQPYFDYVMHCVCGIPSVILEGSPGDWTLLKTKVESLDNSDLELSWWTKHLLPLCDQFVRAASGDVDRAHWRNLCKVIEHYGVDDLNGWLLKFIPYLKHERNEPAIHRNPVLEMVVFPEPTGARQGFGAKFTGCTSDMLPSGISRAPVKLVNKTSGQTAQLEFVAGLVGVAQSPDDLSLRPLAGWGICEGAAIDRLIDRLRLEHEVSPPKGMDLSEVTMWTFGGSLRADVWRFYSETNGAVVSLPNSSIRCRILPLAEIKPAWDVNRRRNELKDLQKRGVIGANEFAELRDFNEAYGPLLRIADLGDGSWYVFGRNPGAWRGLAPRPGPQPSKEKMDAEPVFLWTGELQEESFTFVSPSFTDWLTLLLDGKILPS